MSMKKKGLGLITMGVNTLMNSDTYKGLCDVILSSQVARIYVTEFHYSFPNTNLVLREINKEAFDKHSQSVLKDGIYELTSGAHYIIRMNKNNFMKVSAGAKSGSQSMHMQYISIEFYGPDRYKYRDRFIARTKTIGSKENIDVRYITDSSYARNKIRPVSFDKVFLNDGIKESLITKLEKWKNSRDWYIDNGLVYKMGILLYGKPGTGKSTIVKAISNMFNNAVIVTLDCKNISQELHNIMSYRNQLSGTIIVLFEDIDMHFNTRKDDKMLTEANIIQNSNQNMLFQLLDGVYSTDDTIYIATTNYKDRIDDALIRYGRFNIHQEIDYFNEDTAKRYINSFGLKDDKLKEWKVEYPVQPSYLQSKVIQHKTSIK